MAVDIDREHLVQIIRRYAADAYNILVSACLLGLTGITLVLAGQSGLGRAVEIERKRCL